MPAEMSPLAVITIVRGGPTSMLRRPPPPPPKIKANSVIGSVLQV
jgi:hypothetical protein